MADAAGPNADADVSNGTLLPTSSELQRLQHVSAHLTTTPRASLPRTAAATSAAAAQSQQRPNGYGTDERIYDLLITAGRVIDPANSIDAVLDVAVRWGKVVKVGEQLPPLVTKPPANHTNWTNRTNQTCRNR